MNLLKSLSRGRTSRALVALALAALALLPPASAAQTREERLLNGLRIVFFPRPGDAQVWLKLRLHSGAAFDLAGREGMTQLLADALFPDPATPQYVSEELGGSLHVRTGYDAVDVTLEGRAAEFERLVELLRNALFQMRLTADEVRRLKEARTQAVSADVAPAERADRAAAARLFGQYPYGRALAGTPESLARVERADLMLARERFHIPNNATLVVVGNFDRARAMRVLRQYLGPWRKGDAVAPATFTRPDAPDARALILDAPGAAAAEVRVAVRGLPRSDRDRAAADLLARVARERLSAALADVGAQNVSAAHEAHALAGLFRVGASVPASAARRAVESAREVLRALAAAPVTPAELERAARESAAATPPRPAPEQAAAEDLLDSVTYNFDAAQEARAQAARTPTAADLQRVAARLFRDQPQATVVLGPRADLRAALASLPGGVETPGARAAAPTPANSATPAPTVRPTPSATPAAKPANTLTPAATATPTPTPPAGRRP